MILVLVTLLRACFATKGVLDGPAGRSCLPDKLTFSLPYQVVTARDDDWNQQRACDLGIELQVRARRGWLGPYVLAHSRHWTYTEKESVHPGGVLCSVAGC